MKHDIRYKPRMFSRELVTREISDDIELYCATGQNQAASALLLLAERLRLPVLLPAAMRSDDTGRSC